ncbi:hypothetical protein F5878DRAFT_656924 [Lentinula raphanica]|uniref:Uncharacterized protein n=1 Tax=Lentinula raphanica TaxID=153919 RepID=A0AA38UJ46_9AGAR|nr:hypothetical protein F5878DRAFT_656924 [Lentinula raphanica]
MRPDTPTLPQLSISDAQLHLLECHRGSVALSDQTQHPLEPSVTAESSTTGPLRVIPEPRSNEVGGNLEKAAWQRNRRLTLVNLSDLADLRKEGSTEKAGMPSFPLPLAAAVFYSHPIGPIPSLRLLSPLADAMTIPNPFPSTKLIVEKWWIDIAGAGRVTKREAEAKGGTEYTAGQPTPIITLNASRVHRLHPFITSLPSSPRVLHPIDIRNF